MDYIKRDMENVVSNLTREYSCILITGPRQVGKATILEHLDKSRKKVTLDDLQERNLARTDPEMFLKLHKPPILIDEVQYAPELFAYIKIAIDNGAVPGSFWLTGSQSYEFRAKRIKEGFEIIDEEFFLGQNFMKKVKKAIYLLFIGLNLIKILLIEFLHK